MDEKRPVEGQSMSAVAYVDRARGWTRWLEDKEAERSGLDRADDARPIVARRTGVPAGTLRSLRKNRLKSISAFAYDLLNRAFIRELETELGRLNHEKHLAEQQGLDHRSDEVSAVLADIASVRAALGLAPDSRGGK